MKVERKIAITKKLRILLIVLATLAFFYGCGVSKRAGEEREIQNAAKKIEFVVTERANEYITYSTAKCDFFCTIKNDSKVKIDKISGTFKIMNLEGKVLSSGQAWFNENFEPQSEYEFKLTWSMDVNDKNMSVLETDFSNLKFSFEIEEITYNGYEIVEIKK